MVLSLKEGGELQRAGSIALLVIASTTNLSSHSTVAYLETSSKATRREKAFKSVPLFSKLQPCIFNFLSIYNVIHWHPSQTWAPAACIALQYKLSSHAVATWQEHRGVTTKNAFLDVKLKNVWGGWKKLKYRLKQLKRFRFNLGYKLLLVLNL